jgi:hypothetical protein
MLTTLIELPTYAIFLFFIAFAIVLYSVGYGAIRYLSRHAKHDIFSIPAPAFLGTIATAWALSMGFVAADAWSLNSRADFSVSKERSAIHRLLDTANPIVLDNAELKTAVLNYRTIVIDDEWGQQNNTVSTLDVDHAILGIRAIVQKIALSGLPGPIVSQLVNDFDELQDARNERLAVASSSIDESKWYLVLFLTLLTAITIAAVHADRPLAGKRALVLYVLTGTISLWILANHANPYVGMGDLKPDLLFSAQRHSPAPTQPAGS